MIDFKEKTNPMKIDFHDQSIISIHSIMNSGDLLVVSQTQTVEDQNLVKFSTIKIFNENSNQDSSFSESEDICILDSNLND